MTREEKAKVIEELREKFSAGQPFYLADSSAMTVESVNSFRRLCFENGVEMRVAKNTLIRKALEATGTDYSPIFDALHGTSAILFSTAAKAPATVIKKFRTGSKKPLLKAAYIDSSYFFGDDQVEELNKLKSREELIGDVVALLQAPMQKVLSQLNSSSQKIAGIVKTLSEKPE